VTYTIVCFHAHPDDEALFTGGTMARLAAEGHRVVLVTATAGEAGLASTELTKTTSLGDRRMGELAASAKELGCARVVGLGYADSGIPAHQALGDHTFSRIPPRRAASRLAQLLSEENADVLTMYDPVGGYGHPDHVQVHRVGSLAAQMANTAIRLEATVDRQALQRALRLIAWLRWPNPDFSPARFNHLYTHPDQITHRVDVSGYLDQKRASMHAHLSQTTADHGSRTLTRFLQLPDPLFRLVFGREWFVEQDRQPSKPPLDDVLMSLR
jgi:LmbE family N-acetylglucosaminyl deacetylase